MFQIWVSDKSLSDMKIKRNLKIAIHARKKLVSFFCSSLKETPTNTINNNNKMAEEEKREETGVLYATLHEASSLPDMDSYFSSGGGKSDPYVVVLVDGVEKERSTTFTDCEDPVWNKGLVFRFEIVLFTKFDLIILRLCFRLFSSC